MTVDMISDGIKQALLDYCQREKRTLPGEIHDQMSFDFIGLDSLARVELLETLDKKFQVNLDPTAAYDYVTVRALAEYVHAVLADIPLDDRKVLGV